MSKIKIIEKDFFQQNAFVVAHCLLGKLLVRKINSKIIKVRITELEIYYGPNDTANHGRFGTTQHKQILFKEGGCVYVYLCYGIHNILNIVTGPNEHPEGIMIRGVDSVVGPGKVTKLLEIDRDLNGEHLCTSSSLWIEDDGFKATYRIAPRIGIDYASEPYKSICWRYILNNNLDK